MKIKLDLSDFLEDERKFSVLNVQPKESKTVRDVISKISRRFSVHDEDEEGRPLLGLFDDGFYIHPDETSSTLEDFGILKLKSLPRPGTKGKKKKKKKASVGVVEVEDFEERWEELPRGDDGTDKKGVGQLEGKKKDKKGGQVSSREVEAVSFKEEEPRKSSKKRKRCQFAEDVEEPQGKKRSKTVEWEASVEEPRAGEQAEEKKKRKKDKASREISVLYTSMEEAKGRKQQQQSSKQSHRKSQQRAEEWESPEPHLVEQKRRKLKADKGGGSSSSSSSQDKVVSTSSFLTALDGITSSSSSDLEVEDRRPWVADSMMNRGHQDGEEASLSGKKRRRKRKHKRKDAQRQPDPSITDQPSTFKSSAGRPAQWGRLTSVNTPRTHVIFNSDEEEIAVTEQAPRQSKNPQSSHAYHNTQALATPRPAITGRVRGISGERRPLAAPPSPSSSGARQGKHSSPLHQNSDMETGEVLHSDRHTPPHPEAGRGLVQRRPAHNNLEELAKLRKICESNTITICKVDAQREQPKPRVESRPPPPASSPPPPRRAPPSPPHLSQQGIHDNRHSGALQTLAAMKNRTTPAVVSGVRAAGVRSIRRRSGAAIQSRPPLTNGSSEPPTRTTINLEPATRTTVNLEPASRMSIETATRTTTASLPDDDPLQILSSNLSEIRSQFNQDRQQINVRRRPLAMSNSLGALLSGIRAGHEGDTEDSPTAGQGKEPPRTSPLTAPGNKAGGDKEGTTDLLVLDCEEMESSASVPSGKKEGTPDILCVSPSDSPVPQQQQTSKSTPQQEVSQPKPMQPQASPFRHPQQQTSLSQPPQPQQASPPRLQQQLASPLQPPQQQQAGQSRLQQQLTSPRTPQASPSRPSPQTSQARPTPQASHLRSPLQQTSPSRPPHPMAIPGLDPSQAMLLHQLNPGLLQANPGLFGQAIPGMAMHQPRPSGAPQQATPFRPMQPGTQFRPMQQASPSMPAQTARPQGMASAPSASKWADDDDDDIVDLDDEEYEDLLEDAPIVSRNSVNKTSSFATPAPPPLRQPPPPPPLTPITTPTAERDKPTDRTPSKGKEQDGVNVVDHAESRRGTSALPSDSGTPNRPTTVPARPAEGGMSTGQYIAEILEDCEMVGPAGSGAKASTADTPTRAMPGRAQCTEVVDDDEEEDEVVLDEDEVMLDEEEEGEGEEEEVEGEEVEGEEEEGEDEYGEYDEEEGEEGDGEIIEEVEGEAEVAEEEDGEPEMIEDEEGEPEMIEDEDGETEMIEEEEDEVVEEVQEGEDETDIYANIDDEEEDIEEEEEEEEEEGDDQEQSDLEYEVIEDSDTERETSTLPVIESVRGSVTVTSFGANSNRTPGGPSSTTFSPRKDPSKDTLSSEAMILDDEEEVAPITTPTATPLSSKTQQATPTKTTPPEVTSPIPKSLQVIPTSTKQQETAPDEAAPVEDSSDMEVLEDVTPVPSPPTEVLPVLPKSLQITPVKADVPKVTPVKTQSIEVAPLKPSEVTPVKPKSPEIEKVKSSSPETTPVKPKSPEIAVVKPKSPEITPVTPTPTEIAPVKPKSPEITTVTSKSPETKSVESMSPKSTPAKPKLPEIEAIKPKSPEVEAVKLESPEVEALKPKSPEVEALKPKSAEVTPVKPKAPEVESDKCESPDIIEDEDEPMEVTEAAPEPKETATSGSPSKTKETASSSSPLKPKDDGKKEAQNRESKESNPSCSASKPSTSATNASASSTTMTATTSATISSTAEDKESLKEAKDLLIQTLKEDMVKEIKSAKAGQDQPKYDDFSSFSLMTSPPKAGDCIALKTVVLDEGYSLALSDYRVAKVLAVEGVSIKLKFEAFESLEDPSKRVAEEVRDIDWRDIVEPKLIYKTLQS